MAVDSRVLTEPATVVYAEIHAHSSAAPESQRDSERWQTLREWMTSAFERIHGDDGVVSSYGHDHVEALFAQDPYAAVDTAIVLQEWALENRTGITEPLDIRVGVARGKVEILGWVPPKVKGPGSTPCAGLLGTAAQRARDLASAGAAGSLLIDTSVLDALSLGYLSSSRGIQRGWKGADYLGPVREIRSNSTAPPLVFYEIKWSGEELLDSGPVLERPQRPQRTHGVFIQWNGSRRASIRGQDGEIYWTGTDLIVGQRKLEPGQRVSFVSSPAAKPTDCDTASAVIAFGSELEGTVVSVFDDRRYGFLRVTDEQGNGQDIFLHADDNEWPLAVGDKVVFRVGENVRGAAAMGAKRAESE